MALGQTLSRLGSNVLRGLHRRLELASLDVEEELLRIAGLLAFALAAILLFAMAVAAAAATVVVALWDVSRLAALIGVTCVFTVCGGAIAWHIARTLRDKPRFMAATLAELKKDRDMWSASP
jgi:uncharacterized membrane protein YqjE